MIRDLPKQPSNFLGRWTWARTGTIVVTVSLAAVLLVSQWTSAHAQDVQPKKTDAPKQKPKTPAPPSARPIPGAGALPGAGAPAVPVCPQGVVHSGLPEMTQGEPPPPGVSPLDEGLKKIAQAFAAPPEPQPEYQGGEI